MIIVFVANIIAWPIAYLVMNNWLKTFAYHVQMNLLSFVGSGITIVLLAFLITAIQSINAANVNPIDNLRSE
jgi:putative ABC transport system permease protein